MDTERRDFANNGEIEIQQKSESDSSFGSQLKEAAIASMKEFAFSAVVNVGVAVRWVAKIAVVLFLVKVLFLGV